MLANTNIKYQGLSDKAVLLKLGFFLKQTRLSQNKTQEQLATDAGLNRWTISQIEKGESITLTSFIQVLRALDALFFLEQFEVEDEISPLEYASLKKRERKRAGRNDSSSSQANEEQLGW